MANGLFFHLFLLGGLFSVILFFLKTLIFDLVVLLILASATTKNNQFREKLRFKLILSLRVSKPYSLTLSLTYFPSYVQLHKQQRSPVLISKKDYS